MKVVLPIIDNHTISFIPRFDTDNELVLSLKNEASGVSTDVVNTYSIVNEGTEINFTFVFKNKDRYQIRIKEGDEVVYRGKLICTDQVPQDYTIIKDVYIYEP